VEVAGRPLLGWSLAAFRASDAVAMVAVAAPAGHEVEVERITGELAGTPGEPGAFHPVVVTGGDSRAASVAHALAEVPASADLVAVHDAARPLVEPGLIATLFERLDASPDAAGVIAATPVTDTVKRASADGAAIEATEPRERLWAAQTPQVFRADVLREAHDAADALAGATDDAVLVEAIGGTVLIEPASARNLKLTTRADLRLAELLLAERS
jgi:2-C-methyl-D-erythritol 4-phosphate cytidylyltransferase